MTPIGAGRPAVVFVVGAPRSGTTWLQRLLGSHPHVATSQETDLVSSYLRRWVDVWDRQLPDDPTVWRGRRHKGLPAVLTREQFDDMLRTCMRTVYAHTQAMKPGSTTVVDKSPQYALYVDLLARLAPEAKVVHIVRDGRDVATSLLTAARSWGGVWARRRLSDAAHTWRAHVEAAAEAERLLAYHQLSYEELSADGPATLRRCLEFLGIDADPALVESLLHEQDLTRLRASGGRGPRGHDSLCWGGEVVARLGAAPEEPAGFFGEGGSGGWTDWSLNDRWVFEQVAGAAMTRFGYPLPADWATATAAQRAWFSARHSGFDAARSTVRTLQRSALSRAGRP